MFGFLISNTALSKTCFATLSPLRILLSLGMLCTLHMAIPPGHWFPRHGENLRPHPAQVCSLLPAQVPGPGDPTQPVGLAWKLENHEVLALILGFCAPSCEIFSGSCPLSR